MMNLQIAQCRWELNQHGEGVVYFHKTDEGSIVVFPSRTGFNPPDGTKAYVRTLQPQVGDVETCLLVKIEGNRCMFAYPMNKTLDVDSMHGHHFVLDEDGQAIITVLPAFPVRRVSAEEVGDEVVIRIRCTE